MKWAHLRVAPICSPDFFLTSRHTYSAHTLPGLLPSGSCLHAYVLTRPGWQAAPPGPPRPDPKGLDPNHHQIHITPPSSLQVPCLTSLLTPRKKACWQMLLTFDTHVHTPQVNFKTSFLSCLRTCPQGEWRRRRTAQKWRPFSFF